MSFHSRSVELLSVPMVKSKNWQGKSTLLKLLETLKGDFEVIWITEFGWVLEHFDAEE